MKKSVKVLFLIFVVLLIVISLENNSGQQSNKIDKKVLDNVEKKGTAKVIIKYRIPGKKEGIVHEIKKRMFNVKELNTEKDVQEDLKKNIDVTYVAESLDAVSANIGKADLDKLAQMDSVEEIIADPEYHLFLQDSAPLINATRTWGTQISGINLTGAGEVICVIDSGINYSHPDLGNCSRADFLAGNCSKVIGGYAYYNNVTSDKNDVMGDSNHGTHVAGIIAANGVIKGIAPDAKIVALKACGPTSACGSLAVLQSINWCVGNASIYNISVISMSLGGDIYSDYCDSDDPLIAAAINAAIAKNISVVVATGNDGSTTGISDPACIRNATAVSATTKNDIIDTSYANRNNITDLVAPGTSINSTILSTYGILSGTSMATPHVSGAFALLRQFYKLQSNRTLTPIEIQNVFNSTGKRISDTGTGLNFSRIDVYSAILSLDEVAPNATLKEPANNTKTLNANITFYCNATDLQLKNITLSVWNSSLLYNQTTINVSGIFNETSWNLTLNFGDYNWNCYACDVQNNCKYASSNNTLSVSNLISRLIFPLDTIKTNQAKQNLTCNATSNYLLTNLTLYVWNSTNLLYNETKNFTGLSNQTNFSYTFTQNQEHLWNCLVFNNQSVSIFASSNYTATYDSNPPGINVLLPTNNSWRNKEEYNLSLNENGSCLFSRDHQANISIPGSLNFNYTNSSIEEGNHNVTFYCNDTVGNLNSSSSIFFKIDRTNPNITLISPAEEYTHTASSVLISFQFNVSDNLNISSCKLAIGGNLQLNQSEINNLTNSINYTLTPGVYSWQINCTDEAGNERNSTNRSLTINSPQIATSSNGGSSGGGSPALQKPNATAPITLIGESEVKSGTVKIISVNEKVKFAVYGKEHYLNVDKVNATSATITITSSPMTFTLNIGQEIRIIFEDSEYYYLSIRLKSILNGKAEFIIKEINESVRGPAEGRDKINTTRENPANVLGNKELSRQKMKAYLGLLIIILIMMGILIINLINRILKLQKNNKPKKSKNNRNDEEEEDEDE